MSKKLLKIVSIILCVVMVLLSFSACQKKDSTNTGMKDKFFGTVSGEVSYVMIYNPNIYTRTSSRKMNTGDLAEYVEPVIHRSGEMLYDGEQIPNAVDELNERFSFPAPEMDRSGPGLEKTYAPYSAGDMQMFATFDANDNFQKKAFMCIHAGKYCNIWSIDYSFNPSLAQEYAEAFDNDIYEQMTECFGKARFAENGRKVNILLTNLPDAVSGRFLNADAYTEEEIAYFGENPDMYNGSHSILHISLSMAKQKLYKKYTISTIAHELQHNIFKSSSIYSGAEPGVWINEAMSGYIEEFLFSGIQKEQSRYVQLENSNMIRHGQSLYNFATNIDRSEFDIGVYGSVFLLSEYLAKNSGDDVFSNIHEYWQNNAGRFTTDAEVIQNSVSDSFRDRIDASIDYKGKLSFSSDEEEWLSKMVLDFYLSLLSHNENSPEHFSNVGADKLLYDQISDTDIEGGGRIFVALKDGVFDTPKNADEGMIYIGLDKDFNVVTKCVYK